MRSQDSEKIIEEYRSRITELEKDVEVYKSQYHFLTSTTHELRMYMSPIIGHAYLLRDETSLTEMQLEYINSLLNSGAYPLLNLINMFSDFSKMTAGKMDLEKESVNLQLILGEIIEELSPKAIEKGLSLSFAIEPQIQKIINGDRFKLKQILLNLFDNAVRFTSTNNAEILLQLSQKETNLLYFNIIDTGAGIQSEKSAKLTEFFESPRPKIDPLLISLSLMNAKMLCNLMKGNIWLESEVNKGSIIHFVIPYEPV